MQTDFVELYELLGVRADCSAAEFKHAFRRLIAEHHPDRKPDNGARANVGQISDIIAAYNAAMVFHRQHGRLPGAVQRQSPRKPSAAIAMSRLRRSELSPTTPARSPRRIVFAFLLGVGALLLIDQYFGDDAASPRADGFIDSDVSSTTSVALPVGATRASPMVELGLDMESVLAIEGRPVARNASRWDYGPSWIAFDNGRVSDWHSSPLRPLKVVSEQPLDNADPAY